MFIKIKQIIHVFCLNKGVFFYQWIKSKHRKVVDESDDSTTNRKVETGSGLQWDLIHNTNSKFDGRPIK